MIDYDALKPSKSGSGTQGSRQIYIHDSFTRSWVEWLEIERTHTPVEEAQIRSRIKTLSIMLENTPEVFQVAKCIGCVEDPSNLFRVGLVHSVP
jgi:hypothetical protein